MSKYIQTLRIGLALFLSVFGTSAMPAAAASALESDANTVVEQTQTETVENVETAPEPATADLAPPAEQLPATPPAEPEIPVIPPAEPEEALSLQQSRVIPETPQKSDTQQNEIVNPEVQVVVVDQTCDDMTTPGTNGWTTKFDDDEGYPDTVSYTAPAGYLVDKYCVKAGSTQQGNGPIIVEVIPPASTVTIDYPNKDSISHYVVHLITAPQVTVNPVAPSVDDKCETKNDTIVLPADSAQITYSLVGNVVTATLVNPLTHDFAEPLNGYTVAGDGLTASYTVTYEFTNEPCETVEECPKNTEWYDVNENQKIDEGECFKKVFVCKYVGTPGINERLQTGDNPISVSVNAIKDFNGVGSYFNDAQGRSYVLAFDEGQAEPDASECPGVEEPTVEVLPTVCIAEGQTGTFTVRVTNPNDYAVEYRVDADGGKSETKTIAATSSADFTFSGYAAGTYGYEVFQKVAYDVKDDVVEELTRVAPQPKFEYAWEKVSSGQVTLVDCGRVLGETDVCPNLTGTQSMVPSGYKLVNGQCVVPETPQVLAAAVALPATLPATGASDTSSIYLVLGLVFSALTYYAMLRRYQEA